MFAPNIANALGILISSILSPIIAIGPEDLQWLQLIYLTVAIFPVIGILLSVNRSKPLHPPSAGAIKNCKPAFFRDLGSLVSILCILFCVDYNYLS